MILTMYQILQTVSAAGHTTLTIDDVATDYELRDNYGFGLMDQVVVLTGNKAKAYISLQGDDGE